MCISLLSCCSGLNPASSWVDTPTADVRFSMTTSTQKSAYHPLAGGTETTPASSWSVSSSVLPFKTLTFKHMTVNNRWKWVTWILWEKNNFDLNSEFSSFWCTQSDFYSKHFAVSYNTNETEGMWYYKSLHTFLDYSVFQHFKRYFKDLEK